MEDNVSIHLSSRDSQHHYPENRPFDFKVNIKPPLELVGRWKVGIREISYSSQIIPLQQGQVTFRFLDENGNVWARVSNAIPAELLTNPEDFVNFIKTSFTQIPRRPNTVVRTYMVYDLLELSNHHNPYFWMRTHRRKCQTQQCLDDIPKIMITKYHTRGRASAKVELFDENGIRYFRNFYRLPQFIRREDLGNPALTNPHIYNSIGPLPRKPKPTDWKRKGRRLVFALSDVAEFSYDSSRHQYVLSCTHNTESVCAIIMDIQFDEIDESIKVLQNESMSFINPWKILDMIAVHCDIVDACQFGDKNVNLLAVVPRQSSNAYSHISYKRIRYLPVKHSSLSVVSVQFNTLHGKPVQFSPGTGETFITLEFKKES